MVAQAKHVWSALVCGLSACWFSQSGVGGHPRDACVRDEFSILLSFLLCNFFSKKLKFIFFQNFKLLEVKKIKLRVPKSESSKYQKLEFWKF